MTAKRVLPFAIAAALPFLLTLVFGPHAGSADFIASAILTALLTVVAFAVPWARVPVALRATVPLTYFAVVFLLRNSSVAATELYTPLVLLPVIWLALYGTRGQLIVAFVLLALTLILPILLFGPPRYPATEWRRVAIYLLIAPIVGVTIHRLVTATRERTDRLRLSDARHRLLIENLPDRLFSLYDRDLRLVLIEGAMLARLGLSVEDFVGRTIAEIAQAQQLGDLESLHHAALAGKSTLTEHHLRRQGIIYQLHVAPYRDDTGEVVGVCSVARDITERKRAEAQAHAAEARQATLRERELALTQQAREQLIEQNARLVEIDHMKDEFVALVSHELRTPLTSIVGYLEPILDREAGPLTPTQERFVNTIGRNARALSAIVGDLLFLASVDAGKLTLQAEEVDLAQLLADTVEGCGPSADRRGIVVTVDTDEVPVVRGDRARLEQVTDNLLSNAIKFTPDGGSVRVSGNENETGAVIEIRDTGIGIPADEIPRLFTRFYRATSATEHAISGTGLGLAIVKSIIDAHHGAIEVDSSPGVGTTMRVLLPLR